jgi:NAD(P)-dependent dehydrogenase (short-subunit alcohol dehydrogenase family)
MKISYKEIFSLKDLDIIVVGGLGLIGKEVVKAILDLGANIIIMDLSRIEYLKFLKELNINQSGRLKYQYFNCLKKNEIKKNIIKCFNKNFKPKILINCSYPRTQDWKNNNFKNIKLKSFEKNIAINLNSTVWISKIFADLLVKNNIKGKIINFGSIYGFLAQDKNLYKGTRMSENLTYSSIKGAIINITRQFAAYYGDKGILVNCISPGGVYGPVQGLNNAQEKIFLSNYHKRVPLKRLAHAYEIASVVAFMCSDASSYITGSNLIVDGGWSAI